MATVFFTGFPGFLGRELLPRILERGDHNAVCLVQAAYMEQAERVRAELVEQHGLAGRIKLVVGDITEGDLGLGERYEEIAGDTIEVFHLAAVYDVAVERELAMRVNVTGTKNIIRFCASCPSLRRHQYVSTCFVSGRYDGSFTENDLEKGQAFNNFYEETKFLAELEVRRSMDRIPTTIYRPAIVVGDSATGETSKYDGPYYVIRYMLKQPTRLVLVPLLGDPSRSRMNVVPRNFVIDAIAHLSGLLKSTGKTYALADPSPLTIADLMNALERETGKVLIRIPTPMKLAKAAIDHVPGLQTLLGFSSSAAEYFVHPTDYDTTQMLADLEGTGIEVPNFDKYIGHLVDYVSAHPEVPSAAMV